MIHACPRTFGGELGAGVEDDDCTVDSFPRTYTTLFFRVSISAYAIHDFPLEYCQARGNSRRSEKAKAVTVRFFYCFSTLLLLTHLPPLQLLDPQSTILDSPSPTPQLQHLADLASLLKLKRRTATHRHQSLFIQCRALLSLFDILLPSLDATRRHGDDLPREGSDNLANLVLFDRASSAESGDDEGGQRTRLEGSIARGGSLGAMEVGRSEVSRLLAG
jgi:hypothetical protein